MQFDWQAVAAPAIVLLAVAYLARAFVGKWFRKPKPGSSTGCGSCGSCPSGNATGRSEPEVFTIASMSGLQQSADAGLGRTLPTFTKMSE